MRYIRHVLVAAVAALALMLGCTAAMAATTATPKLAEANDSVSINPVGDQSTYEGIPEVQQYATIQAESSEGLPITFYGASGLPPGLSIDNDTGVISGSIPADAAPVTWSVTVTATDSAGTQGADSFTWSVIDPTTVTNPGNQYGDAGTPVSVQVDGGTSDSSQPSYFAAGLPPGLAINEYTGLISGTPSAGGSYNCSVTVTDTAGDLSGTSAQADFTWQVTASPHAVYTGTIRLTQMGLNLDDRNNSSAAGAIVQVWKPTGGPNQVWQVMSDGTIRHNGLSLTAAGTGNGAKVFLEPYQPGNSRQVWSTRNWRVTLTGSGPVLNDTGYGGNGTQQQVWANTGTRNEIWATS
jgi:hypothetical protein